MEPKKKIRQAMYVTNKQNVQTDIENKLEDTGEERKERGPHCTLGYEIKSYRLGCV